MTLPLPATLSPSKISGFRQCPLAFRCSVIDGLAEPPSAAASKGTLVHRALELLMVRPPADRILPAALADLDGARLGALATLATPQTAPVVCATG